MYNNRYIINNICPVVRCYSNTNTEGFSNLLNSAIKLNNDNILFVMDRSFDTYGSLNERELKLFNMIETTYKNKTDKDSDDDKTNKEQHEEETNKKLIDVKILVPTEHINGTGAFNVAFNYIRKFEKYKNFLFHFSDDDDIYNHDEFNNLLNVIRNNIKTLYVHKDVKNNNIICNNMTFKTTRREKEIIKDINDNKNCVFYNDDILFTGNKAITHLLNSVHTSNCNIWRFLFSPYYYDQLTCRLLLFGREDLDMINYLMLCENDTIITNKNRDKTQDYYKDEGFLRKNIYDLKVSNKLIRLNDIMTIKKDVIKSYFNIYNHKRSSNSSEYDKGKEVHNLPLSVIEYQNNHLNKDYNNNINNLGDDSINFKNKIKAPQSNDKHNNTRLFFYGLSDEYTNGRKLYKDTNKKNQLTDNAEYGIKIKNPKEVEFKQSDINKQENTKGEYYIIHYDVYKLDENYKFQYIESYNMFNNGRELNDEHINIKDVKEIITETINKYDEYKDKVKMYENKIEKYEDKTYKYDKLKNKYNIFLNIIDEYKKRRKRET